jgi:hypothetical protein
LVTIRPEHILYTDEQLSGMEVVVVDDHDPDAPTIMMDRNRGCLVALVRNSSPSEDERLLRQFFDIVRIDWLGVLGYEPNRLFELEGDPERHT